MHKLTSKPIRFFFFSFILLTFFVQKSSFGLPPPEEISLSLPANFISEVCTIRPWVGQKAKWGGVIDERTQKAVGEQSKKGEVQTLVESHPALTQVFETSLKQLFTSCGLQFTPDETTTEIRVAITEFFAGSDKKIFTGTGQARSRLRFDLIKTGETVESVELGFTIENKGLRKGKLKQLQATLNELLAETLKQIPRLGQLSKI